MVRGTLGEFVKREPAAHLEVDPGLSERRACNITRADRNMVRYQSSPHPTPNYAAGCKI